MDTEFYHVRSDEEDSGASETDASESKSSKKQRHRSKHRKSNSDSSGLTATLGIYFSCLFSRLSIFTFPPDIKRDKNAPLPALSTQKIMLFLMRRDIIKLIIKFYVGFLNPILRGKKLSRTL